MPPAIPIAFWQSRMDIFGATRGLLIVLDDAQGSLRQPFLLAAGQAANRAVPSPVPDLDPGNHSLITIDLQWDAGLVAPFRDQDCMTAGTD